MSSYPADLYQAVHCGNEGDVEFYERVCLESSDVLELGCGSGRVTSALRREGKHVIGLDIDRGLLSIARSEGAFVVQADMRRFSFASRFDRILVPYSGLYCLLSEEDVRRCFRCVAKHLRPGGFFVFDAWSADAFHAEADPSAVDPSELVATVRARGDTWRVYEHSDWDKRSQRLDVHYRHVVEAGPSISTTIEQRYLLSDQIEPLLNASGLTLVALLGGFDQEAFDDESEHLIVVATVSSGDEAA